MTDAIIEIIKTIPYGKVAGYGQIAALAGHPRAARQVVRVLHSLSDKLDLPWHRVIRSNGELALSLDGWGALQKEMLLSEGVTFLASNKVDMKLHRYTP